MLSEQRRSQLASQKYRDFSHSVSAPRQEMGCCFCQPQNVVIEDPEVIVWAFVGATAVIHPRESQLINGAGLLHVKDGFLYYQTRVGTCLGCGTKRSWPLSDVRAASAITDGETIHKSVEMDPGLKIIFQDGSTLVCSMPYAEKFAKKLNRHIQGTKKSKKKKESVKVVAMMA